MPTILNPIHDNIIHHATKVALVCQGRQYTYEAIGNIISSISDQLILSGVCKGNRVAVLASRSELGLLLSLAILRAGGVYVPLDENLPLNRIVAICSSANIMYIIGERELIEPVISFLNINTIYFSISSLAQHAVNKATCNARYSDDIKSNDPAIIVFTSGSTGEPKGVVHSHECLYSCNVIDAKKHGLSPKDKVLSIINYCYAFSFQVYQALVSGAVLHISTLIIQTDLKKLCEYIKYNRISVATMPTQLGYLFLTTHSENYLRLLIIGGGVLPSLDTDPGYSVLSNYGCTECVFASYHSVSLHESNPMLGYPNDYISFIVMNNGFPSNRGEKGELWISGPTMALGYLNEDINQNKFIYYNNKKWCKTGDEVIELKNGSYQYLGRLDGMIKLRNQRIEPSEIEYWIMTLPNINQAFVCIQTIGHSEHLCAYYVSDSEQKANISEALRNRLPEYMIPSFYMKMEQIPVNSNGKPDKSRLPIPSISSDTSIKPANDIESLVCDAITSVLSLDACGMSDSFSLLGGDSLDALRVSAILSDNGFYIPMTSIINSRSLRELSAEVEPFVGKYGNINNEKHLICSPMLQQMIFSNSKEDINRFVIPEFFCCSARVNADDVIYVVNKLLNQHIMLKSYISNFEFHFRDNHSSNLFQFKEADVDYVPDKINENLKGHITELYKSINVFSGPMYSVVLLHAHDTDYILTACSHIVSDNYSKEILKADFIKAFDKRMKGLDIECTTNTTPYAYYCKMRNKQKLNFTQQHLKMFDSAIYAIKQTTLAEDFCKRYDSLKNRGIIDIDEIIIASAINSWGNREARKETRVLIYRHGRDILQTKLKLSFAHTLGYFPVCYHIDVNNKRDYDIMQFIMVIRNNIKMAKSNNEDYFETIHAKENPPLFGFDNLGEIREYTQNESSYIKTAINIPKCEYNPITLNMGVEITLFVTRIYNTYTIQARFNKRKYDDSSIEQFLSNLVKEAKNIIECYE